MSKPSRHPEFLRNRQQSVLLKERNYWRSLFSPGMSRGRFMVRDAKFQISLADQVDDRWHDLTNGVNFRLDEDRIAQVWCAFLPRLLRDLTRVGTAVYVTDSSLRGPGRRHGSGRQM